MDNNLSYCGWFKLELYEARWSPSTDNPIAQTWKQVKVIPWPIVMVFEFRSSAFWSFQDLSLAIRLFRFCRVFLCL